MTVHSLSISAPHRVNTATAENQGRAVGVALSDGGYVLTWVSEEQDGSGTGIFAQRFDAQGNPVGAEFQINTGAGGSQRNQSIAALEGGGFVAVWESYGQDGSRYGVYMQRFSATGVPLGPEVQVNDETLGQQYMPHVAALEDGSFAISWIDPNTDPYLDPATGRVVGIYDANAVQVQHYSAAGAEIGDIIALGALTDWRSLSLNPYTPQQTGQEGSFVVPMAGGAFAVLYWSVPYTIEDGWTNYDNTHFFLQRFSAAGGTLGAPVDLGAAYMGNISTTLLSDGRMVLFYASGNTLSMQLLNPATGRISSPIQITEIYEQEHGPGGIDFLSTSSYTNSFDVAQLADGTLMISYVTYNYELVYDDAGVAVAEEYTYAVMAQRYSTTLMPIGPAIVVASDIAENAPNGLNVLALSGGGVTISWDWYDHASDDRDVFNVTLPLETLGTTAANTITGTAVSDWIDGLAGNDRIDGRGGDDILWGDRGNDRLTGGVGADQLVGGIGHDQLIGGSENDTIWGAEGNDTISGGTGADVLRGDLTALDAGADVFVFDAALGSGIDRITDFSAAEDTIRLENAVFTGLATGTLAAGAFVASYTGTAADASDRIIYDINTGALYYDADGTGARAQVQFATLASGLTLTNADFVVI